MSLDVHLYGVRIATLDRDGGGEYRLAYLPELEHVAEPGSGVLSNSLPFRLEPFSPETSRAYLEGLLPQGPRREQIGRELGIDPGDGYGLIAALGRDCPGGVGVLPEGVEYGAEEEEGWLSEEELEQLLVPQPQRLFDPDNEGRMRFSLSGRHHKLALLREEDDDWFWPTTGAPSTHIVKPESGEHPELVPNEMFCMKVLGAVGLWVAPTAVEEIAGRPCLVSRRFDRARANKELELFHQESFPQALGIAPGGEDAEAPGFAEAAGLLRAFGEEPSVTVLVGLAVGNYILGNGDAHPENLALLFTHEGPMQAPFYDVSSTAVYGDPLHRGLTIAADPLAPASVEDMDRVAEQCSLDAKLCRNIAANIAITMLKAVNVVAAQAREEGWHAPVIDEIVAFSAKRAADFLLDVAG